MCGQQANVTSNSHGMALPMRKVGQQDALMTHLSITTHRTRNELVAHYKADIENFEAGLTSPQKQSKVRSPEKLAAQLHALSTPAVSMQPAPINDISSPATSPALVSPPQRKAQVEVCPCCICRFNHILWRRAQA